MMKKKRNKIGTRNLLFGFILLEIIIVLAFFLSLILPYTEFALAGVGEGNTTVITLLQIGNVYPEILNISINNGVAGIDLTANSTTMVNVYVIARDYNGEGDIANITAEFFDNSASSYGAADDNNNHYTNNTCSVDTSYGDAYEVSAKCTFQVEYYSNNATWNATILVTDNSSYVGQGDSTAIINTLLAFALPDSIDYGEVNATAVSDEVIANVTNAGNVILDLGLSGYAVTEGDGNAMNCSLGAIQNISVEYEKYNLTISTPGILTLSQFEVNYTNLTAGVVVGEFNLPQRQNDTAPLTDDTNSTYWRIYVPIGVAGTCSGNIIFGAIESS